MHYYTYSDSLFPLKPSKHGKSNVLDDKLAYHVCLDMAKVSNRNAVLVLTPALLQRIAEKLTKINSRHSLGWKKIYNGHSETLDNLHVLQNPFI